MYKHIENDLRQKGVNRIVLWGGVQATNEKAVNFYKKHGFIELGHFEHNGSNVDMVKDL